MEFNRVNRLSVPEEIIESIKSKILAGELNPGAQLPSESKLAEMFVVGRGTIREAMKIMLYQGLIVRNNSRSTFIADSAREKVLLNSLFDQFEGHRESKDMIEIRKIIEPEAAALAATRKQAHVIDSLEKAYLSMLETDDIDVFIEHDNRFHNCIFNGTGNQIIIDLMEHIHTAMKNSQSSVLHDSEAIKERSLYFHKKLMDVIKDGDAQKAREIMLDHICDIEKEMLLIYQAENASL